MLAVLSSTARVRCVRTFTGSSRVSRSAFHPGLPPCLKNNRAQRTRTMRAAVGSDGPRALFRALSVGASGGLWKSAVLSRLEKFIAETPSGRVRRVASLVLSLGYGAVPHVTLSRATGPMPSVATCPARRGNHASGTFQHGAGSLRSHLHWLLPRVALFVPAGPHLVLEEQPRAAHTDSVLTCRVRCVARHANHPGEVARSWMSSLAKPDDWLSAPAFAGPWQGGDCVH